MKLPLRWAGIIRKPACPSASANNPGIAWRDAMRKAIPACPICKRPLDGHYFQELASVVYVERDKNRLDLIQAVRQHAWDRLAQFHHWLGTENNLVVDLFRCADGR